MNDGIGLERGKYFGRSFSPSRISTGKNSNSPACLDLLQVGALHFCRIVLIQVIDDREAFAFPEQALAQDATQ